MKLTDHGVFLCGGVPQQTASLSPAEGRKRTMAYRILQAHNQSSDEQNLRIRFDAMLSHDITYVGIIQQARASGMKEFPIPYALTNCHNSLCAVGGTINEDDHVFGLSAAKKYGGIYVPANQSVIHSVCARADGCLRRDDLRLRFATRATARSARWPSARAGRSLPSSFLKHTWDAALPEVVLVYVTGKPRRGVGPHDAAIALIKATFANGFVKNRVLEFAGPGIANLPD